MDLVPTSVQLKREDLEVLAKAAEERGLRLRTYLRVIISEKARELRER